MDATEFFRMVSSGLLAVTAYFLVRTAATLDRVEQKVNEHDVEIAVLKEKVS
jgi:hypothetical protein